MARGRRKQSKSTRPEPGNARPRAGNSPPTPPRADYHRGILGAGYGAVRSRTWKLALAGFLIVVAGVSGLKLIGAHGADDRGGPIILISIDTLRADRLPAYGYGKIQTPAIDELASNGTVFESCYSHVPLTLPSHTSILTGLLPSEHGVRDNLGFEVPDGVTTLPEELKRVGYATGGAVSAYVLHSTTGISRGFDWYDDQFQAPGPGTPLTDVRRDGMQTLGRALTWLEERSAKPGARSLEVHPIFLFLHLYEPHAPYTPPPRFQRPDRSPYDGTVMYSDEIVGSLFAGLRRLGLYDPSLIILLSDHGEGLRDHGEETHGVFLYREVMHVPLIIKLPGSRNAGRRIEAPVQLIDIAPTVMDWAALPPGPKLQGESLIPALEGHDLAGDRSIYAESFYGRLHFGWKELFSLTSSRYSFILAPRPELYDTRQDPGEAHNLLAADGAATAADRRLTGPIALQYEKMRDELASYVGRARPEAPSPVAREQLAKLQALGYLGSPTLNAGTGTAAPDPKDRIGDLSLYQQAMRMKIVFMFSKVAETLESVVQNSPRMIDAWDQLSEVQQRLGHLDKAVDALKQSLQIAPQRTPQRLHLVDILIQLGRLDEAREELRTAAAQAPDEAQAWLAFLEIAAGRPEAARQAATRAGQGLPAAVPYTEGVLLYEKGEYSRALPLLQEASTGLQGRSPEALPYVHFFLGDALARESRTIQDEAKRSALLQQAEQALHTELALQPTSSGAATSLCLVHALQNNLQKIDAGLSEFARGNPSPDTYRLIAQLYSNMGLHDRATRWSERAHRAD